MTYDWCCMCGKENKCTTIFCLKCAKQRWAQFGLSFAEALGLRNIVVPVHVLRKVKLEQTVN